MTRRHALAALPVVLAGMLGAWLWTGTSVQGLSGTPLDVPSRLSNAEFWRLIQTFSEADGYFQSENLVSNEDSFQFVIPELKQVVKPGGVYVGVGSPDRGRTNVSPGCQERPCGCP